MIFDKLLLFIKENTGTASVIEAVLVYPVVILSCSFLIYSGLFMCEESMLCDIAQKTAEYKADILSSGDSAETDVTEELKIQEIRKIYEKKRKQSGQITDSELEKQTENRMAEMLLPQKKTKCRIKTEKQLHGNKITVELERIVHTPGVLKLFSKNGIITEKAAASELSSDYCRLMSTRRTVNKITGIGESEDERKDKNDTDESRK